MSFYTQNHKLPLIILLIKGAGSRFNIKKETFITPVLDYKKNSICMMHKAGQQVSLSDSVYLLANATNVKGTLSDY